MPERPWSVTQVGWTWWKRPTDEDNTIELRGMAWDLACPAGHGLRVYTTFESYADAFDIGCDRCGRPYRATFTAKRGRSRAAASRPPRIL